MGLSHLQNTYAFYRPLNQPSPIERGTIYPAVSNYLMPNGSTSTTLIQPPVSYYARYSISGPAQSPYPFHPNTPFNPPGRLLFPATAITTEQSGKTSNDSKKLIALGFITMAVATAVLYIKNTSSGSSASSENHKRSVKHSSKLTTKNLPQLAIKPEFQDITQRDLVAYRIADETFPEVMELMKIHIPSSHKFHSAFNKIFQEAVQRHLDANVSANISLSITEDLFYKGLTQRKLEKAESNNLFKPATWRIGDIYLWGSNPHRIDLTSLQQKRLMQDMYSTYTHEIRHMIRGYARALCKQEKSPDPSDPCSGLFTPYDGAGNDMRRILKAEYGASSDIAATSTAMFEHSPEQLQRYWKDVEQFWLRDDFPLFEVSYYTNLFKHGDPKGVNFFINERVIEELESYMTCRKRMPGNTPVDIVPSDFSDVAQAMYLRDVLRLYYQVNNTPIEQQHPYAQITPFKMIS